MLFFFLSCRSLNMLVDVNLAEEGVLRVVFAAAYQLFSRAGSDSGVALASKYEKLPFSN